ncbi:MAG: hypothetical protein J5717_03465 [Lachnospiraceae bacterium]|nr:hypothetical protein [Lachnospiraceae bacterium]MBR5994230.1 hypothetical protein [Lachnospiraceae bacterium]
MFLMIQKEIKKTFADKKRIIIFFLGMVALILYTLSKAPSRYINRAIEHDKIFYLEILDRVGGEYSKEKNAELSDISDEMEAESKIYGDLEIRDYFKGINILDKMEVYNNQKYTAANRVTLDYIKMQMRYVKTDVAGRRLIYQNGWIELVEKSGIGAVSAILSWMFGMMIMAGDYDSGMHNLTNACINGKKKHYYAKIGATIIIVLLIHLVELIVRLVRISVQYGIRDIKSPMRSVSLFGYSPMNVSLLMMTVILLLIKIVGLLFCVGLVAVITVIVKNSVKVTFVFAGILLFIRYIVPQKVAFMTGIGMYSGKEYIEGITSVADMEKIYFSNGVLFSIGIANLVAFLALCYVGGCIYAKKD